MRRRIVVTVAVVITAIVVVVGSWSLWMAGDAGLLPWQEEPTRIAITPFADLPSGIVTTTGTGAGTPDAAGTP